MSVFQIKFMKSVRDVTISERLVLFTLVSYADKNGVCWPKYSTLSDVTGMTRRGVQGVISRLVKQGKLQVTPQHHANGSQTSNKYKLNFSALGGTAVHPPPARSCLPPQHRGAPSPGTAVPPIEVTVEVTVEDVIEVKILEDSEMVPKMQDMKKGRHVHIPEGGTSAKDVAAAPLKTPTGFEQLWNATMEGFSPPFNKIQKSQAKQAMVKIPAEHLPQVIEAVVGNWAGFTEYAKSGAGLYKVPAVPNIGFFLKYVDLALKFTLDKEAAPPPEFHMEPPKETLVVPGKTAADLKAETLAWLEGT